MKTGIGFTLRDYQQEALDSTTNWFATQSGSPVIVHPTGSGKSVTIAGLCQMAVDAGSRVLVLTHVAELVEQLGEKLKSMLDPELVGIYSAGLGSRDTDHPVIVAQVQSAHRKPKAFGHRDLVVVDEAQMVPLTGAGMYRSLLGSLREGSPGLRLVGLSATPYRLDSGLIYGNEEGHLFAGIAHEIGVKELTQRGLLSPVVHQAGSRNARPDLRGVSMRGGDFVPAELGQAVTAGNLVELAVADALPKLEGRGSVLWFCVTVEHAQKVADELKARGEEVAVIHGDTPSRDRARIVEEFRAGDLRHLVNCQCLTVGFDAPGVDGIIMLRPTASPGLYAQMAGRGLRIAPGKVDCLLVDYGGNVARHGPTDMVRPPDGRPAGEEQVIGCVCGESFSSDLAVCPFCGAIPPESAKPAPVFEWVKKVVRVERVSYHYHIGKGGKPPSMRVTYKTFDSGYPFVSEWLHLESKYPKWLRAKAHGWWLARCGWPAPLSVSEAVRLAQQGMLLEPVEIVIGLKASEAFPKVMGYTFKE